MRIRFSCARWVVAATVLANLPAWTCAQDSAASKSDRVPTLWVCGDSTASNGRDRGWASHLQAHFDPAKLRVVNRARGGRSSRTFISEGLWDAVVAELQPGDFVIIQFGHNDGGPLDRDRARGSLRGIGDETQEVTRFDGKQEVVHTYGWYLRKYVVDTRAQGATPIILSPIVQNTWQDGKSRRWVTYPHWAAQVAQAEGCLFVDAHAIIADRYDQMGEDAVKPFFPEESTHPSAEGSRLNAELIVSGLKSLENGPFGAYLSRQGLAVTPPDGK